MYHLTKDSNLKVVKSSVLIFLGVLAGFFLGYSDSDQSNDAGEKLYFSVSQHCVSDVSEFFDDLAGDYFETELVPFNYRFPEVSNVSHYASIQHRNLPLDRLQGYVSSALSECAATTKSSYMIKSPSEVDGFSNYLWFLISNNYYPIVIEVEGKEIVVKSKKYINSIK